MLRQDLPVARDLVLIGGGHTHALLLRRWGMNPLPGARVTLIAPGPSAAYSGMLPGFVAGHYPRSALDIDLVRLARFANARFVVGAAEAIDRDARTITVAGRPPIAFDVASIDIGITSAMPDLPGFETHGVPAKPLDTFADRWTRAKTDPDVRNLVMIGGGVAGAELAMAMAHATRGRSARVTIIDRGTVGAALGRRAAAQLRDALARCGVSMIEHLAPVNVAADHVLLEDGRAIASGFTVGAAGARPHPWLARTGLVQDDGFITVDTRLKSRDPAIFAVGDCAHMVATPRAKAGVYAVRQAPILFDNLRACLSEAGGLRQYRPQKDYLKLISLGRKEALVERFGLALRGPLLWRWKDRIDRRFMERFATLPHPDAPALPWPRAAGAQDALGPKPMCGGCGAKVGPAALRRALSEHDIDMPGDDAAVLMTGGARQVISSDHLRALTEDPATMARLAAIHALGDVWAMGAAPQAATASIILPRMAPALAERTLREIMQTAREVMRAAGAEIVGGHSTLGAELTIGYTVTGLCARQPITMAGARPGDTLVLTKPIGSGVIMAAEMEYRARGADVLNALDVMCQPQRAASDLLADAHAMTDVTGFGLLGHAAAMGEASRCGIEIRRDAVPLLPGALALSRLGMRSTLYAQNRAAFPYVPDDPHTALLSDPQTGGGLLAAIPGDPGRVVAALRSAGFDAAAIGRVTDTPGQVAVV